MMGSTSGMMEMAMACQADADFKAASDEFGAAMEM
jgi:hypothetical protein